MNFTADLHAHIALPEKEPSDEQIKAKLNAYKETGVTYLRDGGDNCGASLKAKKFAEELGLDYVTPGFAIYKEDHYGSFLGKSFKTFDEYKALVDEAGKEGADFIKLMLSGIIDFDEYGVIKDGKYQYKVIDVEEITVPEISCDDDDDDHDHHEHEHPSAEDGSHNFVATVYKKDESIFEQEELNEMVEYAHSKGFSVMAHANGAANIKAALLSGVDSLEHGYYIDEECASMLAESDTVWVPTVAPVAALVGNDDYNQEVLKKVIADHIKMINRVWYLGGMIGLGTDAGSVGTEHVKAIDSEYNFLKAAINDQEFDVHLETTLAQVQWKFKK